MNARRVSIMLLVLLVAPAQAQQRTFKPCLPKDANHGPTRMPGAPGTELFACWSHYSRPTCVRVNPDTGAMTFEAWPDPPPQWAPLDVRGKPEGARLCALDARGAATKDCRLIAVKRDGFEPDPDEDPAEAEEWGSTDDVSAELDATGTLLLISWVDAKAVHVETWQIGAKDRRLAKFDLAAKEGCVASVGLVGKTLLVDESCNGKDRSWLATPKGKKIAGLGGKTPIVTFGAPAPVAGDVWAFIGKDGRVLLQDVKTGKVKLKTTTVDAPGEVFATLAALADGRIAVFYGKEKAGQVVVVDPAKGAVTQTWPITRCEW
jgi:hypothetical protein